MTVVDIGSDTEERLQTTVFGLCGAKHGVEYKQFSTHLAKNHTIDDLELDNRRLHSGRPPVSCDGGSVQDESDQRGRPSEDDTERKVLNCTRIKGVDQQPRTGATGPRPLTSLQCRSRLGEAARSRASHNPETTQRDAVIPSSRPAYHPDRSAGDCLPRSSSPGDNTGFLLLEFLDRTGRYTETDQSGGQP